MIHNQEILNFPCFFPYFDIQTLMWLQSTQNHFNNQSNSGNRFSNHILINQIPQKTEKDEDIDTQKVEEFSSSSEIAEKKESFSEDDEKNCCEGKPEETKKRILGNVVQRNETKNISKNFGKAILSFAKTNSKFSKKLLKKYNVEKQDLISYIKKARKDLNSLQDLREMWGADEERDDLKRCLRIISHHFMRKHCLAYIYNSRIKSLSAHTKYRHRLMQGMSRPSEFKNIKWN